MTETESRTPDTAILIDQLRPQRLPQAVHPAGCETWACCWAHDGSYFAWSCGNHLVKLIPWDRQRHCQVVHTDVMSSHDRASNANESHNNASTTAATPPELRTLDTGELVWAVHLGSDEPCTVENSVNLGWFNYDNNKDIDILTRVPHSDTETAAQSPEVVRGSKRREMLREGEGVGVREKKGEWGGAGRFTRKDGLLVLAAGLQSGRIKTWNARTGTPLADLLGHNEVIRDLCYSPDGRLSLASASRDGTIKIWSRTGLVLGTLPGLPSKWMYACCWSPDSSLLASVGDSQSVILWDMTQLTDIRRLSGHHKDVCGCDFSPDGALLATSSYDTRVIVWDVYIGTALMELRHTYPAPTLIPAAAGVTDAYIRAVSFSRDGRHIATVSDDGYIRFWDIYSRELPRQVATVTTPLCCRFSPDGAVLAVGTRNGIVTMWMSPMLVSSLQHLCRLAIRRLLPSVKLNLLKVPDRLRRFLSYELNW